MYVFQINENVQVEFPYIQVYRIQRASVSIQVLGSVYSIRPSQASETEGGSDEMEGGGDEIDGSDGEKRLDTDIRARI